MAKLLIIKSETAVENLQYIGDVVGIYSDEHVFSDHELAIFNVLKIKGAREDVEAKLNAYKPRIEHALKWKSDSKWHWAVPKPPDEVIDSIQVYQMPGELSWYRLTNYFSHIVNIESLSAEEKQYVETVAVTDASVDTYISKTVKDVSILPDNQTEIKELKNREPY